MVVWAFAAVVIFAGITAGWASAQVQPDADNTAASDDPATAEPNSAAQAKPAEKPQPFQGSRERLASLGVDDSHFDNLKDGLPLDEAEQETLWRLLFAIQRISLGHIDAWTNADATAADLAARPDSFRGQIVRLSGVVKRVTRHQPLPEAARRLELPHYYRCELELADSGGPAVVFALAVPAAWSLDEPLDARASFRGVFAKLTVAENFESLKPVFVARRVAWHPETVLGDLKMDFGLFDAVRNKSRISQEESECFYQLLAAAGRAGLNEYLRRTARPPEKDYSVVPLFNKPGEQHGELVALTGTARRAILVQLDHRRDRDIIERFGIDHYYQVEIFTKDSQGNPLVFCVRELPEGFPEGPNIYEQVRIPGFFFKSWAYRVNDAQGQAVDARQLAPMLVGRTPLWIRPDTSSSPLAGALAGGLFILAMVGIWLGVWRFNRGDKKFHQATIAKHYEPEQGTSLNDLGIEADGEPDFSGLS